MIESQLSRTGMRSFYGSRAKAAGGLFVCAAFVSLGFWLLPLTSAITYVGVWLGILFFGAISPLWMAAIVRPNRLEIVEDGFSVRQTLLGTRTYRWSDISAIFINRRSAAEVVVWTLIDRPRTLAKIKAALDQPNDYDGYLPAGWKASATEIAAEMQRAHGNSQRSRTAAKDL